MAFIANLGLILWLFLAVNMKVNYIKIKGSDGIYYVDDGQVNAKDGYVVPPRRFKQDFKLWLRVTKMTNGKRIYKKKTLKYPHDTNFKSAVLDAEDKKRIMQNSFNTNVTYKQKNKADIALNILFDKYMLKKQTEIKPRTYEFYKTFYTKHIEPLFGQKKLKDISKHDLNNLADTMRSNGYKERTVLSIKQVLRPLFNHHLVDGDITVNPALQLHINKLDNEVEINLSMDEIKNLMKAIEEYPLEPFRAIFMFLSTGRRLNEVLTLKWENINIQEKHFRIDKENSKSSKTNVYPLSDKLIEALPAVKKSGIVFYSIKDKDKQMNKSTLVPHWKKLYKSIGIKHLRIHDLRHIIGNVMVSNGASLTEVAELLGHSSTTITKRYSKSETYSKKRSLDKFFDIVA